MTGIEETFAATTAATATETVGAEVAADVAAESVAAEAAGGSAYAAALTANEAAAAGFSSFGFGTALRGVGTILSAANAIGGGYAKKGANDYLATQDIAAANNAASTGQRNAIEQQKLATAQKSRARAVAAAGGVEATSPSIVTNESNIAGQGEYNALSALYEGNTKAQQYSTQATLSKWEGDQSVNQGYIQAGSTILQGASSMYSKYAYPYGDYSSQLDL